MRAHNTANKATHSQLRAHNRRLLLRAIYDGVADNRAALAQETQLAKPTVSEVIGELIDEGLLVEEGHGQSTRGGGKRPRLLRFVPTARHAIGVYVNDQYISGALAYLDGRVVAQHYTELNGARRQDAVLLVAETINGLLAQLDAPLLCIGIGIPGVVDAARGRVIYTPHLGWNGMPLGEWLGRTFERPVYLANSTALVAMAQFVYGLAGAVRSFATVRVGTGVGVGLVIDGAIYHGGGEIGALRITSLDARSATYHDIGPLETFLGWPYVRQRAEQLRAEHSASTLPGPDDPLTYLHLRQAIANGDPAALILQDELSRHLAQIFAWIIALLAPDHISLAGPIAEMGEPLLVATIARVRDLVQTELTTSFSVSEASSLVTVGAIAHALHLELGLV
ncbi:MAG: ROK family protein [Anaerolineae bacterium]|nr:ROK family protein [Anaerolineae bacterium]